MQTRVVRPERRQRGQAERATAPIRSSQSARDFVSVLRELCRAVQSSVEAQEMLISELTRSSEAAS